MACPRSSAGLRAGALAIGCNMPSDAQKRATAKYRSKSVRQLNIKFFPKDAALYEHAKSKPNVGEYIRGLIRRDMGL